MAEQLAALLGAALVVLTWASVITTVVVPRRSRARVGRLVDRVVDKAYRVATKRVRDYPTRDTWLASQASTTILLQLVVWLLLFYVGFALLLSPFDELGIGHAFAQAGSSLFTLGYAGPSNASLTAIDYAAAATGMVVVALQIGYLPTLYSAFNRRETEVTLLVSRAGAPPWGPEILARTRFGIPEGKTGVDMAEFYAGWERWAADVSESHTNYPVLTRFRSPHELSSWLVALLAVLDSAALWLALAPGTAPVIQARLCLRMGFTALRSIATSVGLDVDHDPDPDGALLLTYDEYLEGVARISSTTFATERTPEQAWPDFRGWRVNYERIAYALADRLDAVPGPWTGSRRTGDAAVPPQRPANRLPTPFQDQ
ncbi:MAG: hypothetical protein M3P04_07320 [Actinomycetota bacterium]|nr:hypothetical protein [Actinomycetota bacterium]